MTNQTPTDEQREAAAEELLPCPFCGKQPVLRGEDHTVWYLCMVECDCGARATREYTNTRAEASAKWNRTPATVSEP